MRNYFAIAFTIVYLTLTVGVAKTTHYCMGREKNSSLFSYSTQKCICSLSAKEPMPCCKDTHDLLQIEDDHSAGSIINSPAPQFNLIGPLYSEVVKSTQLSVLIFYTAEELNLPPPKVPLYQSYCSLVFYDSLG